MSEDEGGAVDSFGDEEEVDRGTFVANVPRDHRPPEDELASWDRGSQLPRRTSGYSWDNFRKHPPIPCSNPKISASYRGYYRCPACSEKVRLVGYRTSSEAAQDWADWFWPMVGEGIKQAWYIGVDLLVCIGRGLWWLVCKLARIRRVSEEKSGHNTAVELDPAMVSAVAMLAKIAAAQRKGEAGQYAAKQVIMSETQVNK